MTKITYTINKHFYQDGKPCECLQYGDLECKITALALLKHSRLEIKKDILSAQKKGNTALYNLLFNTTFSLTTNIKNICPDPII